MMAGSLAATGATSGHASAHNSNSLEHIRDMSFLFFFSFLCRIQLRSQWDHCGKKTQNQNNPMNWEFLATTRSTYESRHNWTDPRCWTFCTFGLGGWGGGYSFRRHPLGDTNRPPASPHQTHKKRMYKGGTNHGVSRQQSFLDIIRCKELSYHVVCE